MLSKKKVSPKSTATFSLDILNEICDVEQNEITKSIHHRVRELGSKLRKTKLLKSKSVYTKKYLEKSITRLLEIRVITKEIEVLARKLLRTHNKFIMPDIKNSIHLSKAAGRSALESIKENKKALAKIKPLN